MRAHSKSRKLLTGVCGLAALAGLACADTLGVRARAQTFVDVTAAAGIDHVQMTANVAEGLPSPAFMTGGAAAGDFDGDGLVDLVFTRMGEADILYRNQGDGTFEPRTATAGFAVATQTNGVASADIDNDGDLDLYMTSTNDTRNYLYLNDGQGYFTDAGTTNGSIAGRGSGTSTVLVHGTPC